MLLVGDIGGTNARLALFSGDAREVVREETLPSAAHKSLSSAIDAFLGTKRPRLKGATFGIAGPVVGGRVKATNLPWVVDERVLARQLGLRHVTLINDLVALALGAVSAKPSELRALARPGGKRAPGNVVVIAAGTGLGEAALVWDGARLVPCATEGGHADFAPTSRVEWELREFIAARVGGHVSWERVLSGPGLGTLYDFFVHGQGVVERATIATSVDAASDRNARITELGSSGESRAAAEALALFASLYGREAGNLALKYLAVGGVFVAGKIANVIAPALETRSSRRSSTRGGSARSSSASLCQS